MAESDALEWLMGWYASHCDDEWEHSYGVTIDTLDNPGWSLTINLGGTELEQTPFERKERNYGDELNWSACWREHNSFKAACGPRELSYVLGVFRAWAESSVRPT